MRVGHRVHAIRTMLYAHESYSSDMVRLAGELVLVLSWFNSIFQWSRNLLATLAHHCDRWAAVLEAFPIQTQYSAQL